jgi:23S rRNA (cytidine1920-2'-O)/16S rRNA (cytidine1409-2'-O)-methyltransferase
MNPKRSSRRLDVAVAEQASISRERAQALIMAGKVTVDGELAIKSGASVAQGARIDVRDDARFVSRGGAKLERALTEFAWSVEGLDCLDVGASTGGFTDCLLQRGAVSVTAVDVGYGQIAWALRTDPRVRVVERCNFREVDPASIGAPFGFACADVSFISLTKLATRLREALMPGARIVALVKPQFEAGRSAVGRGGVVRDPATHAGAIDSVAAAFAAAGLMPVRLTFSPIVGPAGNIEFLIGAVAGGASDTCVDDLDSAGVVAAAHETLAR